MKRIGEFAKDHHITVRTLRHYEQLGLIEPKHIDPFTGYRYYVAEQSTHLQTIITLKGLGFSLSEIAHLLSNPVKRGRLLRSLSNKLTQARIDLDSAQTRKLGLEALMQLVQRYPNDHVLNLKEINAMSMKDIRKRIPNADLFKATTEASFSSAKANGTALTAILFDLDNLGPINKNYGTAAGDEILDKLVQLIIDNLPADGKMGVEKSWLERNGGDEFCAILEGGTSEAAHEIAENINASLLTTDFSHVGMYEKATVTAGIADLSSGAKHAGELIHYAEMALVDAKHAGRPSVKVYQA